LFSRKKEYLISSGGTGKLDFHTVLFKTLQYF
jgi:hypothetical protein